MDAVRAEPNLERRAERALEVANSAVDAARKAYDAPDDAAFAASLRDIGEAAEVCGQALEETGKDARRRPKHFKRAELRLRELLRRMNGLHEDVGAEDRPEVEAARKKVSRVHEEILLAVMGRKN